MLKSGRCYFVSLGINFKIGDGLFSASTSDTYDGAGRRISKTPNGASTFFLYDGNQILAEYDSAGTLTTKYTYGLGLDEPLVMLTSTQKYFYHADGLGSITAITNTTGSVVEQYDYDPYGKPTIKDGSGAVIPASTIGNRFMFTGREYDQETGLYHYRNRAYSPTLGRFLRTDPIGYTAGDFNLYRYVGNNPINLADPDGLFGRGVSNWWEGQQRQWREWWSNFDRYYREYNRPHWENYLETNRSLDRWYHNTMVRNYQYFQATGNYRQFVTSSSSATLGHGLGRAGNTLNYSLWSLYDAYRAHIRNILDLVNSRGPYKR